MDRQLLEEYDNPTTILLSLRVERTVTNRVTLLDELASAINPTLDALKYRLSKHSSRYEWMCVLAGTRQYATPHVHIYVWAEGDVPRRALVPVVERFTERCEYAPSSGRGNLTNRGTVRVMGTPDTEPIERTGDGGSAGAVYTLTQLAHLKPVEEMEHDELLWGSTVRAWESGQHFRKSNFVVWEDDSEPTVEDFDVSTVSSITERETSANGSLVEYERDTSGEAVSSQMPTGKCTTTLSSSSSLFYKRGPKQQLGQCWTEGY
ncbi:hypothetical protein [Salinigranum sp. GCM10025319]|uniref:hypothetical protein n=1 Tax=Salinigranum sp. GCM10025319 TaxID=3252687 RepID=UPI003623E2B3